MKNYKPFLYLSILLFALAGVLYLIHSNDFLGLALALAFLSLSLGVKATENFQGLSFTMIIFSAVSKNSNIKIISFLLIEML